MLNSDKYLLPDGIEFIAINKNEADFLFKEIVEDRIYLQQGLALDLNPVVVDVGANIGIFSYFIFAQYAKAKVYAFEVIPEVFDVLKRNATLFEWNIELFNVAISNCKGEREFTYYPKSSLQSSCYSDKVKDRKFLMATALHQQKNAGLSFSPFLLDKLIDSKLENRSVRCPTHTLSQIICDQQITRIDLLKIDVEGSEWDVIQGIESKDWEIIKQVAIEIDNDQNIDLICHVLSQQGFRIRKHIYEPLSDTTVCMLYAMR